MIAYYITIAIKVKELRLQTTTEGEQKSKNDL